MGRNEHLFRGRPCNTQRSHENQKLKNGRFQNDENGNAFDDARYHPRPAVRARTCGTNILLSPHELPCYRPMWWSEQEAARGARPPSVSRAGEWKLVWRPKPGPLKPLPPRSASTEARDGSSGVRRNWGPGSGPKPAAPAAGPATSSSRISLTQTARPPFDDGMTGMLATGLLQPNIPGMAPPNRSTTVGRPASVQGFVRADSGSAFSGSVRVKPLRLPSRGPEIATFGSEPPSSARSRLSTVSQQMHSRLGTGDSMRSQRSVSSLGSRMSGHYSDFTSVSQQDEILKRIQGLEDALHAERSLRQQMQELIQSKVGGAGKGLNKPQTIPETGTL